MYTSPSNLAKTLVNLFDRNNLQINGVVAYYQGSRRALTVLEGMRKVVPADVYPVFEIEAQTGANQWATTRAQRPRYTFQCTLTVRVDKEEYGHEYICTLSSCLSEIMTNPQNLQMRVLNETKWDINGGLVDTYIMDSLVEDVSYSSAKEGTVRKATFTWFALIHETFPASVWNVGGAGSPTILRPKVLKAG